MSLSEVRRLMEIFSDDWSSELSCNFTTLVWHCPLSLLPSLFKPLEKIRWITSYKASYHGSLPLYEPVSGGWRRGGGPATPPSTEDNPSASSLLSTLWDTPKHPNIGRSDCVDRQDPGHGHHTFIQWAPLCHPFTSLQKEGRQRQREKMWEKVRGE